MYSRLDGNTVFYPQVQVDAMINEAAKVVNLFTGFAQDRVFGGISVQNWMIYRVPSPVIVPMKIYLNEKEVRASTIDDTSQDDRYWLRGRTSRREICWVPVGTTLYCLTPPDGVGGRTIEVMGIVTPYVLVNPTDYLAMDDDSANLIEDYCVMNLTLKEGGKTFADASKGYTDWLKQIRELQVWGRNNNPNYWVEMDKRSGVTR